MSGIVGSYFNTRGSGVVAKLGTDGQVFTSTGAGLSQGFEAAAGGGSWTKITTVTASSDSTIEFINGAASVTLDGTYKQYRINIINVHPSDAGSFFQVNFTSDAGSNWNVTKTSAPLYSYMRETSGYTNYPTHESTVDTVSGTGVAYLSALKAMGNNNEDNLSGELKIWNPADTTYHKFFSSECIWLDDSGDQYLGHCKVYAELETTSAVDGIQFQMGTGNIDAGTFILYGLT